MRPYVGLSASDCRQRSERPELRFQATSQFPRWPGPPPCRVPTAPQPGAALSHRALPILVPLHERLRTARERAGLTRNQVCAELEGVPEGTLRRWEAADGNPPFNKVAALAALYDVSMHWLAGECECPGCHRLRPGRIVIEPHTWQTFLGLQRKRPIPAGLLEAQVTAIRHIPAGDFEVYPGETKQLFDSQVQRKLRELGFDR